MRTATARTQSDGSRQALRACRFCGAPGASHQFGYQMCDTCSKLGRGVFRRGRCHACGETAMCFDAGGGAYVCGRCYCEHPPLDKIGHCNECGRVAVLQIADRARTRYLCLACQRAEEWAS